MDEPKLEAAVGMSRRWDAREAGREVARTTIEKLKTPPNFFILLALPFESSENLCMKDGIRGDWDGT